MSLGTAAWKVSGVPDAKLQGGIHGNPGTREPPNQEPFSWCLEKGGTVNRDDMVPSIPKLPPSTSNRKPW